MFNKNHQNYYLTLQSFKNVNEKVFNDCVNNIFFNNITKPDKNEQMAVIEIFKGYRDEKLSRGYGKAGFENLIKNLSSDNLETVENSLEKLENELKNVLLAKRALNLGIFNNLCKLLFENSSNENQRILSLILKLLNLVAKDFKGSQLVAKNEKLMKSIFVIMKTQTDLVDTCVEIVQTLSENPRAAQILLDSKYFIDELQNSIHNMSSAKFFSVLSNFIARKPETFAEIEILKSLIKNISQSKTLKCLMLILNCDGCKHHAIEMKIENTLLKVIVETCDDETKTYAIMALRNYLTYGNICTDSFPWKQLLKILIDGTYTKINEFLQESCIQTIRIMSDAVIVKNCLRKYQIDKLRNIPALTERGKEMKKDLLEWLKYRNYKVNEELGKYSFRITTSCSKFTY